MSSEDIQEKRKSHRHLSELPVWIVNEDEQLFESIIKDMSLLGCSIETVNKDLENGSTLYLYLDSPEEMEDKCAISKKVIVANPVYQDQQSIGLSFTSVGTEVLSILQTHLEQAKYF